MTADVQAAAAAVEQAEADLASGKGGVSVARLNKIRDTWRHSTLSAEGARRKAEQTRAAARISGLEEIGAQVDALAAPANAEQITGAVRDVAAACTRLRDLVATYDAGVAELIAAAKDLRAEPAAPGGPRESSAFVSFDRQSVTHKRVRVAPLADRVQTALGLVLNGEPDRGVAEIQTAIVVREPKRPDHLFRAGSGQILGLSDPLSEGMLAQVSSGELTELTESEVRQWMSGELA